MDEKRIPDYRYSDDATRKSSIADLQIIADRSESSLVEIYGVHLGKKYSLDRDVTTIGRDVSNSLVVDQDNVSRFHCKLEKIDGVIFVEDLRSTNGTYLNDVPISRERVRLGDLIKVGGAVFKFISGGNIESLYHEEIYRMTITDGLTLVANKRYLLEFLEREIARAIRFSRSLSLIMFDIDRFKEINDTHGHLAGDHVLKEMCAMVQKNVVRKEELLARYGGEEFVIVLPEMSLSSAATMAEKARRLVEQHAFEFAGTRIPVRISLGVAEMSPTTMDPQSFLRAVDNKLYDAKRSGRNCVVS
jgi:two-component system, cell cycle response regulator